MTTKPWYHSRTAWFNILTFGAVLLTMIFEPGFNLQVGLPLLFTAVANFVLRFSATEAVTFSKNSSIVGITAIEGEYLEISDSKMEQTLVSLLMAVEALNAGMAALTRSANRPEDSEDTNHERVEESIAA